MSILRLDAGRARQVLTTRPATPFDLRIALAFKTPKDADRLVGEEFGETLDDGRTPRAAAREKIRELTSEGVLVPAAGTDAVLASEISSIGHVLDGLAGDLAALGADSDRASVDGLAPAELLARTRQQLTHLRRALRAATPAFIQAQLNGGVPSEGLRLHLGCGSSLADGWINIDLTGGQLRLNLCWDLPFADGSASYVYAAHTLEHLDYHTSAPRLLVEVHRVLAPGGTVRLAVPDMEALAREYAADNERFFREYDRARPEFGGPAGYRTPMAKVMRMAGSAVRSGGFFEHKMGYDFPTLSALLRAAGFERIERSARGASVHEPLAAIDAFSGPAGLSYADVANTLFVEATK